MVLIHEIIHAYDWEIGKIPRYSGVISQWMIFNLYRKLKDTKYKEQIDQLIDIISDSRFWIDGHDLLFMLKSFELDLKLGLSLCTILDNDRVDFIDYLVTLPKYRQKREMEKYYQRSWKIIS